MTSILSKLALLMRELNQTLYFYIDINTKVPWTFIILMIVLHLILKHFIRDGKLTGGELGQFIGIYLLVLYLVVVSYTGEETMKQFANMKYGFFMIASMCVFTLTVIMLLSMDGAGGDAQKKLRLVRFISFIPIIALVLTNGNILYQRGASVRGILPRSESSSLTRIINLKGELDTLEVGGVINPEEIEKIIKAHWIVDDCYIVSWMDKDDKLVKPYAFVVKNPDRLIKSKDFTLDIWKYMAKQKISPYKFPHRIEFISKEQLPKGNAATRRKVLQQQVKNYSELF